MPRSSIPRRHYETDALLLHRTPFGESDLIVSFMSEQLGRVEAFARSARASKKRFAGALEAIHTLRVTLEERSGDNLMLLTSCQIITPRRTLLKALSRLTSAGQALSWLKRAAPLRGREPLLYQRTLALLDALDADLSGIQGELLLQEFGLQLMAVLGFAAEFGQCVRCGAHCPPRSSAYFDTSRGGLICSACGGATLKLSAPARIRFAQASLGALQVLIEEDLSLAKEMVARSLASHVGIS